MTTRYVCVRCQGETCLHCIGRGWVGEALVWLEQKNLLAEVIAKNLIEKKIVNLGQEAWARRAAEANLTEDQFTEIEFWQATGPVKYQMMGLTDNVIDALTFLVGIEVPPVYVPDRPELHVVG